MRRALEPGRDVSMSTSPAATKRADPALTQQAPCPAAPASVILSFDVEEHYRIEAAAHLAVDPAYRGHCRERLDEVTRWLLELLAGQDIQATFFVVGQIARDNPDLV